MSKLNRQQLIDLATKQYFGSVDSKNMDGVLSCFHPDVKFTIQTDNLTHPGGY